MSSRLLTVLTNRRVPVSPRRHDGTPGETQTRDFRVRSAALCSLSYGGVEPMAGFEPADSCLRGTRASQRATPAWSLESGSNRRSFAYQANALPLCYRGVAGKAGVEPARDSIQSRAPYRLGYFPLVCAGRIELPWYDLEDRCLSTRLRADGSRASIRTTIDASRRRRPAS